MHENQRHHNLPTEIIRTLIAVSETGSLTKAAAQLGLSQPAVSSQMKRVESLLGGSIFTKVPSGSTPTKLGYLVLSLARRMMEAHDQMFRLRSGGFSEANAPTRVGISILYADEYINRCGKPLLSKVLIHANTSAEIAKQFFDGFIDIAFILQPSEMTSDLAACVCDEHDELFVWVRSRDFVLRPGSPIPILSCTGTVTDDLMISSLSRAGNSYRIALNSAEIRANLSAAEAGLGLTILPRRMIPASLIEATEYYLPALSPVKVLICARPDAFRSDLVLEILADLSQTFKIAG